MRECKNEMWITGELVKKNLQIATVHHDIINRDINVVKGSLILKDGNGSEIEVNVYVPEFNKNGSQSKAYPSILTVMNEYISMIENPQLPDIVRTKGRFIGSDFKPDGNNEIISIFKISSTFFKRVDRISNPELNNNFTITGIIGKIEDKFKENGDFDYTEVTLTAINQIEDNNVKHEFIPTSIFPIKLVVDNKNDSDGFKGIFYVGSIATFKGRMINKTITINKTEKGAWISSSEPTTFTNTIKRFIITSSTGMPQSINEFGMDDNTLSMLKAKRKEKLDSVMKGEKPNSNTSFKSISNHENTTTSTSSSNFNPFV